MATLQKLSWHGVCIATSKQASLIMTVLAATMNSSSHLACRLVDVLEMVVEKYTHMINNKIDMGQKYVIAEKDNTSSCFLEKIARINVA